VRIERVELQKDTIDDKKSSKDNKIRTVKNNCTKGKWGMSQHETWAYRERWRGNGTSVGNKEMTRILTGGRKLHDDMEVLVRG
jgi:hypothetical protein